MLFFRFLIVFFFYFSAADIAKYCSLEHTKQCSIFAQSTYPPKMDSDLASRGMTCTNDAEECLYKFYMSSVSMLHRDLTMASVMKKREEMTYNMADMMNNMNVMMANITRMVSMDDGMMRDVFMNFSMLSHFMDNKTLEQMKVNVENLISAANSDDHMVTYAKVKIKTCAGFYEAWTCMMEKGSESGLSSVAVQGLNITLKQYFSLISSMCSEASVMHLTERKFSFFFHALITRTVLWISLIGLCNKCTSCRLLNFDLTELPHPTHL